MREPRYDKSEVTVAAIWAAVIVLCVAMMTAANIWGNPR